MKIFSFAFLIVACLISSAVTLEPVLAQTDCDGPNPPIICNQTPSDCDGPNPPAICNNNIDCFTDPTHPACITNSETSDDPSSGNFIPCTNDCTSADLVELINNVINFLVFQVAIVIAVVVIAWAGALYVLYPYKPGNVELAKKMVRSAVIGFGIVLSAYLLVKFLVVGLVGPNPNPAPGQEDNTDLVSEIMNIFNDAPGDPNN